MGHLKKMKEVYAACKVDVTKNGYNNQVDLSHLCPAGSSDKEGSNGQSEALCWTLVAAVGILTRFN